MYGCGDDNDEGVRIPVLNKPVSTLEVGLNGNNLAAMAKSRHPVDDLQRRLRMAKMVRASTTNPFENLDHVRRMYGSGLAMRLATEQKIANELDRNGCFGIGTNGGGIGNMYREIVTGQDVQIDFTDYLSLPEYRPDVQKPNLHNIMEHQLGMNM